MSFTKFSIYVRILFVHIYSGYAIGAANAHRSPQSAEGFSLVGIWPAQGMVRLLPRDGARAKALLH